MATPIPHPPGHATPPAWSRVGPGLGLVALILLLVGAWFLASAQPRTPNLMDKRWGGDVQTEWNAAHGQVAMFCFLATAAISLLGIALHRLLGARRADASRQALLWLAILAGLGAFYAWVVAPPG